MRHSFHSFVSIYRTRRCERKRIQLSHTRKEQTPWTTLPRVSFSSPDEPTHRLSFAKLAIRKSATLRASRQNATHDPRWRCVLEKDAFRGARIDANVNSAGRILSPRKIERTTARRRRSRSKRKGSERASSRVGTVLAY